MKRSIDRREFLASTAGGLMLGAAATSPALAQSGPRRFPAGFLWGSATSAFQVEGIGDGRGLSIWDSFSRRPGAIKDGSNADIACDHYHRYPDDLAMMRRAGLKAYRFSIAWPRVLPSGTGAPDQRGLDFYSRLVDATLAAGMEPWVCLFHWDLPQAIQDRGGWGERSTADAYLDYASLMARRLGDRVTRWAMFNEPSVHAIIGHGLGEHAPGFRNRDLMFAAIHHQNLAQGKALAALRGEGAGHFSLGTVLSLQPVHAADGLPANYPAAQMWDALWNRAFLDPLFLGRYPAPIVRYMDRLVRPGDLAAIRQPVDFLGVNYYSRMYQKADPNGLLGASWGAVPQGVRRTAMDWPIEPDGLLEQLVDLRDHYGNPTVYITENGADFQDRAAQRGRVADPERIAYLRDHIAMVHQAIAQGCNLKGYFAWTLLDNFEWAYGYTSHFGLVQVDRTTLQRTPKASYDWFAGVAQSNAV